MCKCIHEYDLVWRVSPLSLEDYLVLTSFKNAAWTDFLTAWFIKRDTPDDYMNIRAHTCPASQRHSDDDTGSSYR